MTDIPEDVLVRVEEAIMLLHANGEIPPLTSEQVEKIASAAILADREARKAEPVALQYRFEPDLPWHTVEFVDQIPSKRDWPALETRGLFAAKPDASATIARLEQEKEELMEGLNVFGRMAAQWDGIPPPKYFGDIDCEMRYPSDKTVTVTVGQLRKARDLIAKHGGGE